MLSSTRRRAAFAPRLDGLERREVLTGGPTVTQVAGLVRVAPDPATPTVATLTVDDGRLDLDVNGQDWYFDADLIQHVVFDASGTSTGVTWINDTAVTTTAYAGAGQNRFVAGHGVDVFVAWQGSTDVVARDGHVIFLAFGPAAEATFEDGTGSGMILLFGADIQRMGTKPSYGVYRM